VLSLAATDLLGGFFDVTYAYRFGPPSHDVVEARLTAADGQEIDDAVLFPLGRGAALREAELSARLIEDEAGWAVAIRARRFAQSARIVCDGWDARDAMIHVSPQAERRVPLDRRSARAARPRGEVRALGCAPARF
jgi:beta-mannosidase